MSNYNNDRLIELEARLADAIGRYNSLCVTYSETQAKLAEAERLILRMSGEGFERAKMYVEKYDLTGERAAAVEGIAADQTTACRIFEYDGAFKCLTHKRLWGAVIAPQQPCVGWFPPKE